MAEILQTPLTVLHIVACLEERAAGFEVDGGAQTLRGGDIQKHYEVRLGLVGYPAVGAVPGLYERVDAGGFGLRDVTFDRGALA